MWQKHTWISHSQYLRKSIVRASLFPPHLLKFLYNTTLPFPPNYGSHWIFRCLQLCWAQTQKQNKSNLCNNCIPSTFLFLIHKSDTIVHPFPPIHNSIQPGDLTRVSLCQSKSCAAAEQGDPAFHTSLPLALGCHQFQCHCSTHPHQITRSADLMSTHSSRKESRLRLPPFTYVDLD